MRKTLHAQVLRIGILCAALCLLTSPARADLIDFTVDESVVPGAFPNVFDADKIVGAYVALLSVIGPGTLASHGYIDFLGYRANDGTTGTTPASQLGPSPGSPFTPFFYAMYATLDWAGVFASDGDAVSVSSTTGSFALFIDPNQDTTKSLGASIGDPVGLGSTADDFALLSGSLTAGSGTLEIGTGGFLDFTFGVDQVTALGSSYYPTLGGPGLTLRVDGDIDMFEASSTQALTGDVSVVFEGDDNSTPPVPEPSLLVLLSVGVLAFRGWRNRSHCEPATNAFTRTAAQS